MVFLALRSDSSRRSARRHQRADASGARYALLLGDDEVASGSVTVKPLREGGEQRTLPLPGLVPGLLDATVRPR